MDKQLAIRSPAIIMVMTALAVLLGASTAYAAPPDPSLEERIETLERELLILKQELQGAQQAEGRVEKLETELAGTQQKLAEVDKEARAEERAATKFHLAGYAAAGFEASDNGAGEDSFTAGSFNPIFHFQYNDNILFESELEFEVSEDGETETELEYSSLNWFATDYLAVKLGKWLSPIGQFQERMHPAWINKLPNAPAGFGHGGVQPASDVGVQLRGGVPVLQQGLFTYVVAVGNGPRVGGHGLELEGFGSDDNSNKSVGGRLGFLPVPFLEFGVSYLTAEVTGEEADMGPVTDGDYDLWGADFAFTRGPWDFRGEYLNSELDSFFGLAEVGDMTTNLIPATEWEAWYLQLAYQLSGFTNAWFLQNLELVGRYGEFDIDGFNEFEEHGNEERFTAGINYLIAPSVIAKLAWESREFDEPGRKDEGRLLGQFAFGF